MERCLFCNSEPASFPVIIGGESRVICDDCVRLIPDFAFIRCSQCGNVTPVEADQDFKEDTIMEACFKQGMNKLEVAEELITSQWTPLILTIADCTHCTREEQVEE